MSTSSSLMRSQGPPQSQGLADVLERVLNTGVVIAGDIQVNLLDIELLTIKIRLLIASADTAQQMGIDWWKHDEFLSSPQKPPLDGNDDDLRGRLERIETAIAQLAAGNGGAEGNGESTAPQTATGSGDEH